MPKAVDLAPLTRQKLAQLYPDFRLRVIEIYQDVFDQLGRKMNATETLRDFERQAQLFAQGRSLQDGRWIITDKKLIATNAPPGKSFHHYGLACDSAFAGTDPFLKSLSREEREGLWGDFGRLVQARGCVWGGDWNGNGEQDPNDFDRPHCQKTYGLTIAECERLYRQGGIAAVWARVDAVRGIAPGTGWDNALSIPTPTP